MRCSAWRGWCATASRPTPGERWAESPSAPGTSKLITTPTGGPTPRSRAVQLAALAGHVDHLPRDVAQPQRPPEQRIMLSTLTDLRLADIEFLARANNKGVREGLDELLTRLGEQLPLLSDKITQN